VAEPLSAAAGFGTPQLRRLTAHRDVYHMRTIHQNTTEHTMARCAKYVSPFPRRNVLQLYWNDAIAPRRDRNRNASISWNCLLEHAHETKKRKEPSTTRIISTHSLDQSLSMDERFGTLMVRYGAIQFSQICIQ
jgi:hypothetical protein